jgi:hypothetical protein
MSQVSDHHYDAATKHVKQAEKHFGVHGQSHASDLHWNASGEHLLAAELHKSGDKDNASKAATKAERLSSAAWKASKLHEDVARCPKCGKIKHSGTCKKPSKIEEDGAAAMGGGAPTNNVGSGAVAGLGVGPQGEPGVDKRKKKNPIIAKMIRRKK